MLVVKIDKEFIVNDAPERGSGKTRDVVFDESELQRRLGTQFGLINVGAPLTYQMHAHTHALFGAAVPSVLPTPRKEARR